VASPKQYLAIDLGSSTLKLGLFQQNGPGQLTFLDYAIRDLGLDPNKEQERYPFLLEALQSVLSEKRYVGLPTYCTISGQFVFTRFVKLPPVAAAQVDQMIGFEAQQNVPFPINEVVWDYQLLGGKNPGELEAVIVAVKADLVEAANRLFSTTKLQLQKVDVAPLALVNAYKYNYAESADCNLVIDIGAKSTNLVFIEGSKIFCRSVPYGGYLISQNISNEFQEPYVAAEVLKKGKGFVGLGGVYADPEDRDAAQISKIARSVFSRLHAEVSRSISFYRNQQGGVAPQKVLLAGGTATMRYADLFFREKLNVPVEYFNPLKNINLAPELNRDRLASEAYLLGEVIGLGLRRLENVPIEIDLVPLSVREARARKRQLPYLAAAVLVVVLAFALLIGVDYRAVQQTQETVTALRAELTHKTALSDQITKADEQFRDSLRRVEFIKRAKEQRDFWPGLLTGIYQATGKFPAVWITKLELDYFPAGAKVGRPVSEIPKDLPVAPAASAPNARPGGRPVANVRRPAAESVFPPVSNQPLNLAPKGTDVLIYGFYEHKANATAGETAREDGMLNDYVAELKKTDWFGKVEIVDRLTATPDDIAVKFAIRATLKETKQADLLP
jgi:type IV pilus assembly protein PilM